MLTPAVLAALGGVAGLVLGSFIGALTWRWPRGESVMRGRSRCDVCGVTLGWLELVPVLGFLWRRGRCGHCGAVIAWRHLGIELAGAGVGALALGLVPGGPGVALAGFGLMLLALAILDVEHFWLPDRLTLPLLAGGLVFGLPPLADRLWGAGAGFAGLWLLAAIGAWLGWTALPFVLLGASLVGLLLVGLDRARGREVAADTALPLGSLMALVAWPVALLQFGG